VLRLDAGLTESLRAKIREVPDFPRPGILFYDITTLLADGAAFRACVDSMVAPLREEQIDVVIAIESRGFIFGSAVACALKAGFAPVRKVGKLPWQTISREYQLEYASNVLELHRDAVTPGEKVLVVDDLLATGGTIAATLEMVEELGGQPIGVTVLAELSGLRGRERLAAHQTPIHSLITY
jgi:adenine phosphoribosyltransferase